MYFTCFHICFRKYKIRVFAISKCLESSFRIPLSLYLSLYIYICFFLFYMEERYGEVLLFHRFRHTMLYPMIVLFLSMLNTCMHMHMCACLAIGAGRRQRLEALRHRCGGAFQGRMHSGPRTQFGIPKHLDQEPGPQVEMCVYIIIIYNIYI